ncbi:ADP-ribosylglycohydrolase family protein [Nocardiopsis alba]|uniref:ADP-ribosylglycohydrolase family protein n=1 Tax=Nocardiopsis alba TaxID=53437 RepID=UPI0033ABD4BF
MRTSSPLPDRLTGCLMGGAVGDALGAPVEGLGLDQIRERYGTTGLSDYVEGSYGVGAITDETQLTLRTADALLRAHMRARDKGIEGAALGMVQASYLEWLNHQMPSASLEKEEVGPGFGGAALRARRGYGAATVDALRAASARVERRWVPLGTPKAPINNSKGCAAVVRVAPCGFLTVSPAKAFDLGSEVAALTHGHRTAHLAAGTLAATVWGLVRDEPLESALETAREELEGRTGHEEVSSALDKAVAVAERGIPEARDLAELGDGWTSEEALAVAMCVALSAEAVLAREPSRHFSRGVADVGEHCLPLAVNHSGDSDTIGAICGGLIGARYGSHAFPGHWQSALEVRDEVIRLAADCALEFGPYPPSDQRYGGVHHTWFRHH